MIDQDHITINDDTALWVFTDNGPVTDRSAVLDANRPCDPCNGVGWPGFAMFACNDCDGTGRHTFTVECECDACPEFAGISHKRTLRVHVIDVLPIINEGQLMDGTHTVVLIDPTGQAHLLDGVAPHVITLPPAAEPGSWLVRLAVHR